MQLSFGVVSFVLFFTCLRRVKMLPYGKLTLRYNALGFVKLFLVFILIIPIVNITETNNKGVFNTILIANNNWFKKFIIISKISWVLEKCLYTYGYYHIVDSDIRYCTLHVCLNFSLRQRVPIIDVLQNNLLEYLSPFYTLKDKFKLQFFMFKVECLTFGLAI